MRHLEHLDMHNSIVVLFGAGEGAVRMMDLLMDYSILPSYFVDNNPQKKSFVYANGLAKHELEVKMPNALLKEDSTRLKIIITPYLSTRTEIMTQIKEMGLNDNVIDTNSQMREYEIRSIKSGRCKLPVKVRMDAATLCQLNCTSCGMRKSNYGILGKGYLKFADFKQFIDNHPFIRHIELANYGEIFLNPELRKIIEYAYTRDVMLTANGGVNFNSISDEIIEVLVKYRFYSMKIAIDGASQETYSIYRRNGDFTRVIDNILKLNDLKRKYCSSLPKLVWQYVLMQHNEDDVAAAKRLARQLNMEMRFKLNWDREYKPIKTQMLHAETGLQFLTRDEWEQKNSSKGVYMNSCWQLWFSPQINWDGRLLGCCTVGFGVDFGVNVFEVGLERALNSDSYRQAKLMLLGEKQTRQSNSSIPCIECDCYIKGRCGFDESSPLF